MRIISRLNWCLFGIVVFLGIISRVVFIDSFPAINADETWYPSNLFKYLDGQIYNFRTPNGMPWNPFQFLPLYLVLKWLPNTFTTIRIVPLFYNFLTLLLLPFALKPLGDQAKKFAISLASASTILIIFSRISWDTSILPFSSLIIISLTLRGKYLWAYIISIFSILIHPTSFFLISFPLVFITYNLLIENIFSSNKNYKKFFIKTAALSLITALIALALKAILPSENSFSMLENIKNPNNVFYFFRNFLRIITGAASYLNNTGFISNQSLIILDCSFLCLFFLLLISAIIKRTQISKTTIKLIVACIIALLLQFISSGALSLSPDNQRYGMYIILPSIITVSSLISDISKVKSELILNFILVVSLFNFFSVYQNFFSPLYTHGGSGRSFIRTAKVEPKIQTYQVLKELSEQKKIEVAPDDYWLYWPLTFLGAKNKNIIFKPLNDEFFTKKNDLQKYIVSYHDGPYSLWKKNKKIKTNEIWIKDNLNRPLISISRIK